MQPIIVELTRNQNRVYKWLQPQTNFRREVVCSARRLALEFNWSDQYAMKILDQLEDHDALSLLRRGVGQRGNKYRVNKVRVIAPPERKQRIPTLPQEDLGLASRTPSATDERGRPESKVAGKGSSRLSSISSHFKKDLTPPVRGVGFERQSFITRTHARETRLKALSRLPQFTVAVRKQMQSPFNRFEKKKYQPETWNAQDIVCYYALLYRHIYGTLPNVDWRRDCGAARNLLTVFSGHPEQVKLYLQIAFGSVKRSWTFTSGLAYFTYSGMIDRAAQIRDQQSYVAEQYVDDYDDRVVLSS